MDIRSVVWDEHNRLDKIVYDAEVKRRSMELIGRSLDWSLEGEDGRWQDNEFPTILDTRPITNLRGEVEPHRCGFFQFLDTENLR